VIVDSTTSIQENTLAYGVTKVAKATMMNPTMQGYSYRKAITINFCKRLIDITAMLNRHIIFVAHEDEPVYNDDGVLLEIPVMLGGKIKPVLTSKITEIWNITDVKGAKYKRIAVRPCRSRKPMATRMFQCGDKLEFDWQFDADTWQGDTISKWHQQWKDNGFAKIPLPVTVGDKK
jgi:hypothetical protein